MDSWSRALTRLGCTPHPAQALANTREALKELRVASSEVGTKPGLADQHEHQLKLAERLGTAVTLIKADPSRGTTKALELIQKGE